MVKIAQNPYYIIKVDEGKNRILLNICGGWGGETEVSQYLEHWDLALRLVQPGFTILSDIREAKEHSPEVRWLHLEAQRKTLNAGLAHVAEVHRLNESGSDYAIDMAQESKIPLNIFDNVADAEAWLEEIVQEKKRK